MQELLSFMECLSISLFLAQYSAIIEFGRDLNLHGKNDLSN